MNTQLLAGSVQPEPAVSSVAQPNDEVNTMSAEEFDAIAGFIGERFEDAARGFIQDLIDYASGTKSGDDIMASSMPISPQNLQRFVENLAGVDMQLELLSKLAKLKREALYPSVLLPSTKGDEPAAQIGVSVGVSIGVKF